MSGAGSAEREGGASERGGREGERWGSREEGRRPAPGRSHGPANARPELSRSSVVRASALAQPRRRRRPEGRRAGAAARGTRGRRPPQNRLQSARDCRSRPPAPRRKQLAPGLPGRAAVAGGRWESSSVRGSGSPCSAGRAAGHQWIPGLPPPRRARISAAGARRFESGPREGARLGRPQSGGPAGQHASQR